MDVMRWQISLFGDSGNYEHQPGLGLRVELKCRVCDHMAIAQDARTIHPRVLKTKPKGADWFKFQVNDRIGRPRYCSECGTGSMIPPRQQETLLKAANASISTEWLLEAVSALELRVITLPEDQEHYAQEVYASCAGEYAMEWRDFAPALV